MPPAAEWPESAGLMGGRNEKLPRVRTRPHHESKGSVAGDLERVRSERERRTLRTLVIRPRSPGAVRRSHRAGKAVDDA